MNILVLGAGGFIGGHLCKRLRKEGHDVIGVDIKPYNQWYQVTRNIPGQIDFPEIDLTDKGLIDVIFRWMNTHGGFDEVYQLAADMGGAGYIFTGDNDANVMHNSALINLNIAKACVDYKVGRVFYSSSACIYPGFNQQDPDNPNCREESAYPSLPDSEYGWEKLFSERLYKAFERNYGLNVRIARFHNIFGPYGTYTGGKEKAPAAICRKVAECSADTDPHEDYYTPSIDIWGDGKQTRSFLYIDECIEGVTRLMRSDCKEIVNIGSEEMISINDLARMVIDISGKDIRINNIEGPIGVRGRNSDNRLIRQKLGWVPSAPLRQGMEQLYKWVNEQINGRG